MSKNNDETIDWSAKRRLDDSIYTDTEQAYLAAKKIVSKIREQTKQHQIKQQFKFLIKSIKAKLRSGYDYADIPYSKRNKH